jgi:hypothetical protein
VTRAIALAAMLAGCGPDRAPIASVRETAPPVAAPARASAVADAAVLDAAPASCVDDGQPFAIDALRDRVAALASIELDGRAPGTPGDAAARALVADRLRCLGVAPAGAAGTFEQPFAIDGASTANVVGVIAGADEHVGSEIVLVGAHLDHLGDGFLGANDNASGVVGLLAIAQAARQHGSTKRTIAFVAFGGEERGLVGSTAFAARPPDAIRLDRVVEYINLDMIGSHASHDSVAAFGAFAGRPATKLLRKLAAKYRKLHVGIGGHSVRGDQVSFCTHDIPYVFFWTPDDRCYHRICDTADRLDYPRMADIASLASELVLALADSDIDLAASRARHGCR